VEDDLNAQMRVAVESVVKREDDETKGCVVVVRKEGGEIVGTAKLALNRASLGLQHLLGWEENSMVLMDMALT